MRHRALTVLKINRGMILGHFSIVDRWHCPRDWDLGSTVQPSGTLGASLTRSGGTCRPAAFGPRCRLVRSRLGQTPHFAALSRAMTFENGMGVCWMADAASRNLRPITDRAAQIGFQFAERLTGKDLPSDTRSKSALQNLLIGQKMNMGYRAGQ
jgi:hypothetical protein